MELVDMGGPTQALKGQGFGSLRPGYSSYSYLFKYNVQVNTAMNCPYHL
jgi:hypothetical protein